MSKSKGKSLWKVFKDSAAKPFQASKKSERHTSGACDGETKYALLCRLLVSFGSRALRDIFDKQIPPADLCGILKRDPVHSKLLSLRTKGILKPVQWSKLYPTVPSSVSSAGFDPALLIVLLRTICDLSPPTAGWDVAPHSEKISSESDIARLKYFMNAVSGYSKEASVSDTVFSNYWQQIRDTMVRIGGAEYKDDIDEMKNQELSPLDEEHFLALLKQWKDEEDRVKDQLSEWESAMKTSGERGVPYPTHVIESIRQIYKTREGVLQPFPWCEDISFRLDDIFTRLRIVSKEKKRGTLTGEVANMTGIFRAHERCQRPRTVLIEGDPGMGKTTYSQKLAYDWATKRNLWDNSFPDVEVLLLLRCHDIKTDIWEAIDDQILPDDVDEEARQSFFQFIRENQSKVLLVLDGLDEAEATNFDMYITYMSNTPELSRIVWDTQRSDSQEVRSRET